jgi:hypothetical protein
MNKTQIEAQAKIALQTKSKSFEEKRRKTGKNPEQSKNTILNDEKKLLEKRRESQT